MYWPQVLTIHFSIVLIAIVLIYFIKNDQKKCRNAIGKEKSLKSKNSLLKAQEKIAKSK
jgi:hypothetical protein